PDRTVSLSHKHAGDDFMEVAPACFIALYGFLAIYAIRSMRNGAQTIQTDRLIASDAQAVSPFLDAGQCRVYETNVCEITFQKSRGEVAFFSEPHLIHSVRRILDGDAISIVHTFGKCIAPAREYDPKFLDVTCVRGWQCNHSVPRSLGFNSFRPPRIQSNASH